MKRTPLRAKAKREPSDGSDHWRVKFPHWPVGWLPEEPLKGYKRGRDDCFRWNVEDLLYANGWKCFHLNETKRSDPGFPDLECHRERTIWLELKVRDKDGRRNSLSPAQLAYGYTITQAHGEWHEILWPDQWDELVEIVKR